MGPFSDHSEPHIFNQSPRKLHSSYIVSPERARPQIFTGWLLCAQHRTRLFFKFLFSSLPMQFSAGRAQPGSLENSKIYTDGDITQASANVPNCPHSGLGISAPWLFAPNTGSPVSTIMPASIRGHPLRTDAATSNLQRWLGPFVTPTRAQTSLSLAVK